MNCIQCIIQVTSDTQEMIRHKNVHNYKVKMHDYWLGQCQAETQW